MESHLVRIINRLEAMAKDGGNLKRNFEREGVVVAEVAYSHDEENGSIFTLRDVEARETYTFDSIDLIAIITTSQSCNLFTCFTPQSCYNESIEIWLFLTFI